MCEARYNAAVRSLAQSRVSGCCWAINLYKESFILCMIVVYANQLNNATATAQNLFPLSFPFFTDFVSFVFYVNQFFLYSAILYLTRSRPEVLFILEL